jgi:hypothetical protein
VTEKKIMSHMLLRRAAIHVQSRSCVESIEGLEELRVPKRHGFVKVLRGDRFGGASGLRAAAFSPTTLRKRKESRVPTMATASTSGTRTISFSFMPIMYEGVSGVASRRALTASKPWSVGYHNGEYRYML